MWDDIAAWSGSAAGARVLQTAVVPALAILVAGVVAALIGRAMARAVLARGDRDRAASAVAGLVESARLAAGGERDRAARLRTEADVRTRLLPLPGAALAADWAAARIDALRADASGSTGVAAVRDALLAWTRSPRKAKRLFAEPTPARPKRAEKKAAAAERPAEEPAAPPVVPAPAPEARPAVAETTVPRHAEAVTPAPPAPAAEPAPSRAPAPEVPAWQRTKAGEQLREQRTAAHAQADEDEAGLTAPVTPLAARAEDPAPVAPVLAPSRATEPARTAEPGRKQESPAWLDDYDDEAQVTQNLTLRTPPPVAATSVRDRKPNGSDIVPRG